LTAAVEPDGAKGKKAMHEELMEQVVKQENATAAWRAVQRNQGAPGIDGMTTEQAVRSGGPLKIRPTCSTAGCV
jgi:hypothetical protein